MVSVTTHSPPSVVFFEVPLHLLQFCDCPLRSGSFRPWSSVREDVIRSQIHVANCLKGASLLQYARDFDERSQISSPLSAPKRPSVGMFFRYCRSSLAQPKEAPGNILRQRTRNISGLKLDWDWCSASRNSRIRPPGLPAARNHPERWDAAGATRDKHLLPLGWMPGPTPLAVKR